VHGGDSLQKQMAATNIRYKQPHTANKWWSSSFRNVVGGLTTPHCKKPAPYKMFRQDLRNKDQMGGACSMHGRDKKFIQNCLREETTQKTQEKMRG
jgi:hypothetical protein